MSSKDIIHCKRGKLNLIPDELLGRKPVSLMKEDVQSFLTDKVILVTGGGGTIGSEICRQAISAGQLIILDNYENNAYELQQELSRAHKNLNLKVEIASIQDRFAVDSIFKKYHPQLVFHAAAHKHVPLMEDCPAEAVKNNIFGTYNVITAAKEYKAEKFVLISTDKAVNPTNVMGASKRFCEMLLQSMKNCESTRFAAVRFGNVLGSNGSVIPLFQSQIDKGGPITLTDKNIVRYFMTVTEAACLVLKAGEMASSAEIYVLDMGKPVRILKLAERLIKLNGYIPYKDIDIIETGLRPGEKLYEELIADKNELTATVNHKIFIEKQEEFELSLITHSLEQLKEAVRTGSSEKIRMALKEAVPTYKEPSEVNKRLRDFLK
ncbi:UDP-N-acetylglucosamine 4,6-dehydratase family protein [Anaerocolumna xylanovorans]|uniref:Polysaccharide biosynthesis protein n=1 Tax=Anaerocolumna xylanovorans DSM 12503 TaxID=1121345 RepID=A0A1M7Y1L6_9FIRM|nr:SDR family NAD(P)-dependent oxidoreductase [Anaerocolumna xylanovorans]SHO45705.1 Polysaccharide biosynthesis protein [Anaerocolumna xylanovorans DSM 12503]